MSFRLVCNRGCGVLVPVPPSARLKLRFILIAVPSSTGTDRAKIACGPGQLECSATPEHSRDGSDLCKAWIIISAKRILNGYRPRLQVLLLQFKMMVQVSALGDSVGLS